MNITVSLREDEVLRIQEITDKTSLTRHEVIKLALRLFLFRQTKDIIVEEGRKIVNFKNILEYAIGGGIPALEIIPVKEE